VGHVRVDEAGLVAWGRAFANSLRPPVVVGLSGELGAGKTTLVRAIAAALGVAQPVTSPTFALVHRYDGAEVSVFHVDAYRLKHDDEARDLGFEDMLADPRAVVLVEWPERLGAAAPRLDHHLRLGYGPDDGTREIAW
jgi:tRNA threonylcarbamoyladenosine biosynthesis protein TsaE